LERGETIGWKSARKSRTMTRQRENANGKRSGERAELHAINAGIASRLAGRLRESNEHYFTKFVEGTPTPRSPLSRLCAKRGMGKIMWLDDAQALRKSFDFRDKDWVETEQLKKDIKAHIAQNPSAGLSLGLFNRIATWKLRRQESRTRHFRSKITADFVQKITICAFSLVHSDRESLSLEAA
jgi:hypothetical protein